MHGVAGVQTVRPAAEPTSDGRRHLAGRPRLSTVLQNSINIADSSNMKLDQKIMDEIVETVLAALNQQGGGASVGSRPQLFPAWISHIRSKCPKIPETQNTAGKWGQRPGG